MIKVLTIAGFDPSGGAGILADIKTFEANNIYGFAVCSALTYQNDIEFNNVEWISAKKIIKQLEIIFKRFTFDFVKIGLVKDLKTLHIIVKFLKSKNNRIKIIWDPILKATAGFDFHKDIDKKKLKHILPDLYLITPNRDEAIRIFSKKDFLDTAKGYSKLCAILLKNAYGNEKRKVKDLLIYKKTIKTIESEKLYNFEKHGSGCVLSSAILANLAKGFDLMESCKSAKYYISCFLKSNKTLLGEHKQLKNQKCQKL